MSLLDEAVADGFLKAPKAQTPESARVVNKAPSLLDSAFADGFLKQPAKNVSGKPLRVGTQQFSPTHPVISAAQDWLGTPYVFGGTSKKGIDCSAFTRNVYSSLGISLPRTAREQFAATERVDSPQPGDLVFLKGTQSKLGPDTVSHVMIYAGGGKVIQAASGGRSKAVRFDGLNSSYNIKHFAGFGRVKGVAGVVEKAQQASAQAISKASSAFTLPAGGGHSYSDPRFQAAFGGGLPAPAAQPTTQNLGVGAGPSFVPSSPPPKKKGTGALKAVPFAGFGGVAPIYREDASPEENRALAEAQLRSGGSALATSAGILAAQAAPVAAVLGAATGYGVQKVADEANDFIAKRWTPPKKAPTNPLSRFLFELQKTVLASAHTQAVAAGDTENAETFGKRLKTIQQLDKGHAPHFLASVLAGALHGAPMMAGAMLGGGAAGAVSGATAGRVAGAAAFGGAMLDTSTASAFDEVLRQQKVDTSSKDALEKFFSNPADVANARRTAIARGLPEATVNALMFEVAGALGAKAARVLPKESERTVIKNVQRALQTGAVEAAGGAGAMGGGYAAGRVLAGEKIDPEELKRAAASGAVMLGVPGLVKGARGVPVPPEVNADIAAMRAARPRIDWEASRQSAANRMRDAEQAARRAASGEANPAPAKKVAAKSAEAKGSAPTRIERDQAKSQKAELEGLLPDSMPQGARDALAEFEVVSKSPYSDSFYDITNKDFDDNPVGARRLSDHFNYRKTAEGPLSEPTDREPPPNSWILAKREPDGLWHIEKTWPKQDTATPEQHQAKAAALLRQALPKAKIPPRMQGVLEKLLESPQILSDIVGRSDSTGRKHLQTLLDTHLVAERLRAGLAASDMQRVPGLQEALAAHPRADKIYYVKPEFADTVRKRLAGEPLDVPVPTPAAPQAAEPLNRPEAATPMGVEPSAPKPPKKAATRAKKTAEPKPEPSPIDENATGIANQVQAREAEAEMTKIIHSMGGKSAEEWQRIGQKLVDEGADYKALAERIAKGTEELTGEKVGILIEGKRRLMGELNRARNALDAKPGAADLINAYDAAKEAVREYEQNIQVGKGKWSDVGRALQGGVDIDTGNFAQVIAEYQRKGGKLTPEIEAKLKAQTEQIQKLEADLKDAEERASKANGTDAFRETRKRKRSATIKQLDEDFQSLVKQISEISSRISAGVDPEALLIIGKMVANRIERGALTLAQAIDEVLPAVRKAYPEITEREVRDAFSGYGMETAPRQASEAAKTLRSLKTEARLLSQIEDALKGEYHPGQRVPLPTARVRELRQQLDGILKEKGIRKSQTPTSEESRYLRLKESLDNLLAGNKPTATRSTVDSARIANVKARLREVRSQSRLKEQIAEYEQRLRTQNFDLPTSKARKAASAEVEELRYQRDRLRYQIQQEINAARPMTKGEKLLEVWNLPRATQAALDLSFALRQGGLGGLTAHPVRWTQAMGAAMKALVSEKGAFKAMQEIENSPLRRIAHKARLYIAPLNGTVTRREEVFISHLAEKLPGVGKLIRASERHYVTMGNKLRFDLFADFVKRNPQATEKELFAWAGFLNAMTGRGEFRGSMAKYDPALTGASVAFYSPRFMLSRVQAPGYLANFLLRGSKPLRMEALKDVARTTGTVGAALGLASLAGARVGTDPDSPDFLKIRHGNTRYDILSGYQQSARLGLRILKNLRKPEEEREDPMELVAQFFKYKVSPSISTGTELMTGKNVLGQKVSKTDAIKQTFMPLAWQEIEEAFRDQGISPTDAAAVSASNILGVSTSTYEDKAPRKRRATRRRPPRPPRPPRTQTAVESKRP